jgi:hypothetical protein
MANTKISALSSASTPLSGSEIIPLNKSGITDSVSVANLTAGRAVAAQALTLTNGEVYLILNATGGKQWDIIAGGGGNITPGYLSFWNGTNGNKVFSIAPSTSEQFTTDTSGNFNMVAGNVVQGTSSKGFNFTANTPASGMTSQLLSWYEEGTWTPGQGSNLTVVGAFSSSGSYTRVGRLVSIVGYVSGATSVAFLGGGVQIITGLPFAAASTQLETLTLINNAKNASSTGFVYLSTIASVTAMSATPSILFSATYHV